MPSSPDFLTTLAQSALAGDRRALESLCRELQGPLYRLALRVLGDPDDARDATQESLLLVVTHLSQFRADSRLLTWAYTVASRHLLRTRASRARVRQIEALEARIQGGLALTEAGAEPEGEARVLERETRLACTQGMLACLNLEERMAIVLTEMLGADDELGARLCDVPPATYRKRLSRARAHLRPVLEQACGVADPALPCRCARQARAKQLVGETSRRWTHLPVVDDAGLQEAYERLGEVRRLGPLFGVSPPIAPPEALWRELRARLGPLLDEEV